MTVLDSSTPLGDVTGELPVVMRRARPRRDSVAVRGWLAAVLVYVTAGFHRSALGVAGLDAADRFEISPGALSVFVLLQLGVYAAMQVPTGILVDRFGPRRLLLAAASMMATAQLAFAVAPDYPSALAARTLLGAGDALTFVSLLRFVSLHFSARRYTAVIALTGMLGAIGGLAATVPLNAALHSLGWTPTFAGAATASIVAIVVVWTLVPEADPPSSRGGRRPGDMVAVAERIRADVRAAWARPGTRAAFWVHSATMPFPTMFGLLWGVPYLVSQGFSRAGASAVLSLTVVTGVTSNLFIGATLSRFRAARLPFALTVGGGIVIGWGILLFGFDGRPPHFLLALAVALSAVGGPASAIAFSLARDYNPTSLVGTASGIVNVGGFAASIVAAVTVGRVLDIAGVQDVTAFRVAFALAAAIQAFGAVQAVRWYRRLRARVLDAQGRGEEVPVPAIRRFWDLGPEARW
jgi:MFS family permease